MDEQRVIRRLKNEILQLNERLVQQEQELSAATVNSQLENIASEIRSTRFTLLCKIRERIKTEDLLDFHRTVLTPAHLIPFEIWAQIFSLCMPDTRYPRWDTQFTPVVLGRVCSRWRSMTRLMPELWSSISLPVDILPRIDNKRPRWMPLIHTFLNRSIDHPLSIQIIWYQSKFERGQFIGYFLDVITSASTRWKDLDITVPSESLRPFLNARLPILESFTIGSSDPDPPLDLRHAPRLRSVVFSGLYLRPLTWSIPWNQLTELVSKSLLGINDVKRILHQCPHLQCLQLRVGRSNPVSDSGQVPELVVLPELKRFAMVIRHGENVFPVLNHFECSALEEIRFSGAQRIPSAHSTVLVPKPYVLALISRSKCLLRKIIFENFPRPNDLEIRDLLARIPSLTEAEINHNGNDVLNDDFKAILADRRARISSLN